MKGVDTPVLLDLLRGRISARALAIYADGEELATTEVNLFELEAVARNGPRVGLDRRLAAVERLRGKLTVLPVEAKGVRLAAAGRAKGRSTGSLTDWLVLGAARAAGCSSWATLHDHGLPALPGLPVVQLAIRVPKSH